MSALPGRPVVLRPRVGGASKRRARLAVIAALALSFALSLGLLIRLNRQALANHHAAQQQQQQRQQQQAAAPDGAGGGGGAGDESPLARIKREDRARAERLDQLDKLLAASSAAAGARGAGAAAAAAAAATTSSSANAGPPPGAALRGAPARAQEGDADFPLFPDDARPLGKVHEYIRQVNGPRAQYPHVPVPRFDDYANPTYDAEAARIRREDISAAARRSPRESLTVVEQSLVLMTRRGHRHRVSDLIGGEHLGPDKARSEMRRAPVFDRRRSSGRDYSRNPLRIHSDGLDKADTCALPCLSHCSVGNCDSPGTEAFTMENVGQVSPGWAGRITSDIKSVASVMMSTSLQSTVPVPYFSWHDFGVLEPPRPKTGLAASFISNCGFPKRNQMVRDLQTKVSGDRVDSFGACVSNRAEPGGRQFNAKLNRLRSYKFSLSFENSETDDYITEKFFEALIAGSVPVYIGAPNVKFFAPDTTPFPYESNSVLWLGDVDFDSSKAAQLLELLDKDEAAYLEMLRWKERGYNDDFKVLMDLTDVWSPCRVCLFIADSRRQIHGPDAFETSHLVEGGGGGGPYQLFVRERGSFTFTAFAFPRPPKLKTLVELTLAKVRPREKNLWKSNQDLRNRPVRVYAFYTGQQRLPVLSDEDIAALPSGAELDVIFT